MKTNQLKAGALLSYAQIALNVLVGILYTPVMLRLLGKSEYGLYNTVASTISMLSILSLGFNSGYIRYYAKYKKANDCDAIFGLNGLFLLIFTIIGAIAFVCGWFLSSHLHIVFDTGLTAAEYDTARILMRLLAVNLAISFPAGVFSNIISANERFVFLKLLGAVKTVAGPLVTLPLLLAGYGSVGMVTVTLALSVTVDLIFMLYVLIALKNRFTLRGVEHGLFRSLFIYTSFIALNLIVDQINLNVDKFLLGRFCGTGVVAVYSVGFSLYQYYAMLSTSISGVFTPRIHKQINSTEGEERRAALTELFVKVGRIQWLLLALVVTGFAFFGKQFIAIWAGDGYEDAYYVLLLLAVPAIVPLTQNVGIEVQRALNKHHFRSIVYTIMALCNLVLTVFLAPRYGAIGAASGTAISFVLANGIAMNIYYHKQCEIDILAYWKAVLRLSLGLLLPAGVGILLMLYVVINTVLSLFLCIFGYTIVYCFSMWFFGMNGYEKKMVLAPIRRLARRKGDGC